MYAALYTYEGERLRQLEAPFVVSADLLIERLQAKGDAVIFVGDGIKRIAPLVENVEYLHIADPMYRIPRASSLLVASRECIALGETENPMDMVPYYIRRSEAEVLWEAKHKNDVDIHEEPTVTIIEAAGREYDEH